MTASEGRVWAPPAGPPDPALDALHVWSGAPGYPFVERLPDGELVVLASTGPSPDETGVPAGTARQVPGWPGLLTVVPPGYGLLVDGATPGRRVVPAEVLDRLRAAEPPLGDEPDVAGGPVPVELRSLADAVEGAARRAGARGVVVLSATGGGRSGLWVAVRGGAPGSLDAALDVVAAAAPAQPVRVLDVARMSWQQRSTAFSGPALGAAPRPGGLRARLPVLGGLAVAAALVVQAVRGLR